MDTKKLIMWGGVGLLLIALVVWGCIRFAPVKHPAGTKLVPGQYGGPSKADRKRAAEEEARRNGVPPPPDPDDAAKQTSSGAGQPAAGSSGG